MGQPELSDDEFDALVQRETAICQEHPDVLQKWQQESGLGQAATRQGRVGASTDEKPPATLDYTSDVEESPANMPRIKRQHLAPMLSLDNVHNHDQLVAWLQRIPKALDRPHEELGDATTRVITLLTEPKLDGLSLSLRYIQTQDGGTESTFELDWASTRGDGRQGHDVTPAISAIPSIPSTWTLSPAANDRNSISVEPMNSGVVEIRGEVILPNRHFQDQVLLQQMAPNSTFSNARNAASGILLRKEIQDLSTKDTAGNNSGDAAPNVVTTKEELDMLRSKLQFYAYDLVLDDQKNSTVGPSSLDGKTMRVMLTQIGFDVPEPTRQTDLELVYNAKIDQWEFEDELRKEARGNTSIENLYDYYDALSEHREGNTSKRTYEWGDFEMDGCVHKVTQTDIRQAMGHSQKSPRWAVAHKFPPKAAVTRLLNISVQVGRTGALTPVAELEPVDIGGVTIQRATLHNFGHLQQMMGGSSVTKGTPVLVRRAGDVIPQVVQRAGVTQEESDPTVPADSFESIIQLSPPTTCPACSSPVVYQDLSSKAQGQVVRCGGPPLLCPPRAVTSLTHAYSRDAMDVSGLSEARVQQLLDAELIRIPSDIFQIDDEKWSKVEELPGWGKKSCGKLRNTCRRVATQGMTLQRYIYSLGTRHVGKHTSQLLADCFGSQQAFMAAIDAASKWEPGEDDGEPPNPHPFAVLDGQLGIGPSVIQSLLEFSKNEELVEAARELGKAVLVIEGTVPSEQDEDPSATHERLPWKGWRVVFTGSIPEHSRDDCHAAARKLGAKATPGSVSKSTDLVVFGDKGGKKLDKAQALGIQTMSADNFLEVLKVFSISK
eukprot:Nitzschia sp. Nitz4//scaffold125_size66327//26336//28831//NITZ4_006130-RA/size66327-processed-gene-0.27-mRNA-1//-1//CDS//3329534610//1972//frame0